MATKKEKVKKLANVKKPTVKKKGKKVKVRNIHEDGGNLKFNLEHPDVNFNNPFIVVNPPTKIKTGTKKEKKQVFNPDLGEYEEKEVEVPVLEEDMEKSFENVVKNAVRGKE